MSSGPGGSSVEAVSRDLFRRACGRFTTGVAVAAAMDLEGSPHALTINSFTSVSLEPPLALICLAQSIASIEVFRQAKHFGLSFLAAGQAVLSERFARYTEDRFEGIPWRTGPNGTPLMEGAIATIECSLVRWLAAGDHDIFLGEMASAEVFGGEPLLFFGGEYRRLG